MPFPTKQITIKKSGPEIDWHHLEHSTLRLMGYEGDTLSSADHVRHIKSRLRMEDFKHTFYANPAVHVASESVTREFLLETRRQQRAWFYALNQQFGSADRVKRFFAREPPLIRQLAFTGILLLGGRHIAPHEWPDPFTVAPSETLIGRKFGRLTVLEELPGKKARCSCSCGEEAIKLIVHLISDRTKSCGCLRDERIAAHENRKIARQR